MNWGGNHKLGLGRKMNFWDLFCSFINKWVAGLIQWFKPVACYCHFQGEIGLYIAWKFEENIKSLYRYAVKNIVSVLSKNRFIGQCINISADIQNNGLVDPLERQSISCIWQLIKIIRETKKLYMIFIDLQKAYDRVLRCMIWWVLNWKNVSLCYIDIIRILWWGLQVLTQ